MALYFITKNSKQKFFLATWQVFKNINFLDTLESHNGKYGLPLSRDIPSNSVQNTAVNYRLCMVPLHVNFVQTNIEKVKQMKCCISVTRLYESLLG